jgi:hypothetical protein
MSCWSHDLPFLLDSMPIISIVIPVGWWIGMLLKCDEHSSARLCVVVNQQNNIKAWN